MLDLLASKGAIEILEFLERSPQKSSTEINSFLTVKKGFTTATIYRRIKELEVAGFIIRESPGAKTFILSSKAKSILEERIRRRPVLLELKRTYRSLLHQLKEKEGINVQQLREETQFSPNTVVQGLQELQSLGLIEQVKDSAIHSEKAEKPKKQIKKSKLGPGRPAKFHRLTKKGKEVYKEQKKLEEEQTK
jgi:DeoR/GlpR family transcriptional regulator of sugar metabolism